MTFLVVYLLHCVQIWGIPYEFLLQQEPSNTSYVQYTEHRKKSAKNLIHEGRDTCHKLHAIKAINMEMKTEPENAL